jgi:hypothetical protein
LALPRRTPGYPQVCPWCTPGGARRRAKASGHPCDPGGTQVLHATRPHPFHTRGTSRAGPGYPRKPGVERGCIGVAQDCTAATHQPSDTQATPRWPLSNSGCTNATPKLHQSHARSHPGHTLVTPWLRPGHTQVTPTSHPGNVRAKPKLHPNMSILHPRRTQVTPKSHPGYTEVVPGNTYSVPGEHPEYTEVAPKLHPGHIRVTPGLRSGFALVPPCMHPTRVLPGVTAGCLPGMDVPRSCTHV